MHSTCRFCLGKGQLKIAQRFNAGPKNIAGKVPARDDRLCGEGLHILSPLTRLPAVVSLWPSDESLGYFHEVASTSPQRITMVAAASPRRRIRFISLRKAETTST